MNAHVTCFNDYILFVMFKAMMKVSKDFFMYESGVYKCSKLDLGSKTGYHTVRIVGWGEEHQNGKTVKYWVGSMMNLDDGQIQNYNNVSLSK